MNPFTSYIKLIINKHLQNNHLCSNRFIKIDSVAGIVSNFEEAEYQEVSRMQNGEFF